MLKELTMPKGGLDHFRIEILSHMGPLVHLIWVELGLLRVDLFKQFHGCSMVSHAKFG